MRKISSSLKHTSKSVAWMLIFACLLCVNGCSKVKSGINVKPESQQESSFEEMTSKEEISVNNQESISTETQANTNENTNKETQPKTEASTENKTQVATQSSTQSSAENPSKSNPQTETGKVTETDIKEFIKAKDAVAQIRVGWNVGNSLDSFGSWINGKEPKDYETAWGNPQTTKELIRLVKQQGFNAVRVPVTYFQNMDKDGRVDEKWLARVKEVVDYVIAEDMYCIINVHHDTGADNLAWLKANKGMYNSGMDKRFKYLWEQIASYFKDYNDKLMFEGMNEILDSNSNWTQSDADAYWVVNSLNQIFVDTVRQSGGNNAQRNLVVLPYAASPWESALSGFVVPRDTAEGHLILEVHMYEPWEFSDGSDTTWDAQDEKRVVDMMKRVYETFVKKHNLPLIVGEFGARDKQNTAQVTQARASYAKCMITEAGRYGIKCFAWDDGSTMSLIDRKNNKVAYGEIIRAMMEAVE